MPVSINMMLKILVHLLEIVSSQLVNDHITMIGVRIGRSFFFKSTELQYQKHTMSHSKDEKVSWKMECSEILHNGRTLSCEVGEQRKTGWLPQNLWCLSFCLIENISVSSCRSNSYFYLNFQSISSKQWGVSQVVSLSLIFTLKRHL